MEYPESACIKPPGGFLRPSEAFSVLVPVKGKAIQEERMESHGSQDEIVRRR
jgi:hypothetical protein